MAGEVIVDALPYIDQGYDDPGVREAALAMVEEECRRYRPTKNYLEHLPPLNMSSFETEMMSNEFERIHNRLPMEPLSMKRYELPPPPPGKLSEILSWSESVDNSMAQLEHQAVRALNLELMLEYGIEAWKAYLEIFTALQAKALNKLQDLKKEIQEVNWQRKSKQTGAGEKLRALEAQWVVLVSKNYEIEQACVKLEEEIIKCKIAKGIYDNHPTSPQYVPIEGSEENGYKDNEVTVLNGNEETNSKNEQMNAQYLAEETNNAEKIELPTEKSKDETKHNDEEQTDDVEMEDKNTT